MEAVLSLRLLSTQTRRVYAQDLADRVNSNFTSIGLLALAVLTTIRQYIFKPIQCWAPAEWPLSWEDYAETFCWTQGTYWVSLTNAAHPAVQKRGQRTINYYQWVPIVLLVQAVMVQLPHQLWLLSSTYLSGSDPHTTLRFASEVDRAGSPQAKQRLWAYTARHLAAGMRWTNSTGGWRGSSCGQSVRQSGSVLFVIYMLVKATYACSAIGQILMLQAYLGFQSPLFGWHCVRDLLLSGPNQNQWQQTGVFPRLTFCDVPLRFVGQWNVRSVQCVLAANMVFEKIFVFLWFWFAFCCLATVAWSLRWLLELLPVARRRRIVRSHLRLLATAAAAAADEVDEKKRVSELVSRLQLDGVFQLMMIGEATDSLCAAQVLDKLTRLLPSLAAPNSGGQTNLRLGPTSNV